MNLLTSSVRNLKHGRFNYHRHVTKSISKRKLLFGSTILFGAVAPSLLSDSFSRFSLETHSGDSDAKQSFEEKFKHILQKHRHEPILFTMIGLNLCVYAFWKINPNFMRRHFLCNLDNIQSKRSYLH